MYRVIFRTLRFRTCVSMYAHINVVVFMFTCVNLFVCACVCVLRIEPISSRVRKADICVLAHGCMQKYQYV